MTSDRSKFKVLLLLVACPALLIILWGAQLVVRSRSAAIQIMRRDYGEITYDPSLAYYAFRRDRCTIVIEWTQVLPDGATISIKRRSHWMGLGRWGWGKD